MPLAPALSALMIPAVVASKFCWANAAIAAARESQSAEDPASIDAATEAVTQALHKVSEQVYQRAAAEQQGAGDQAEETVEDADYEVIDEDEPAAKA